MFKGKPAKRRKDVSGYATAGDIPGHNRTRYIDANSLYSSNNSNNHSNKNKKLKSEQRYPNVSNYNYGNSENPDEHHEQDSENDEEEDGEDGMMYEAELFPSTGMEPEGHATIEEWMRDPSYNDLDTAYLRYLLQLFDGDSNIRTVVNIYFATLFSGGVQFERAEAEMEDVAKQW